MARYASRRPRLARRVRSFMGVDVDGSEAGRSLPFVRLEATAGERLA
ncbi:hypothetical protein QOM21_04870 [Streptomyces sp. Pv4-95]